MIDRTQVEKRLRRLAEVEAELSRPEIQAKPAVVGLVREHAALKRLQEKADRYFRLHDQLAENRVLAADPAADPDLTALAREEIAGIERSLPDAEKELRVAILPPDPDAGRNAVVEIRAGTGGDEAALFAADLFRMYGKFCARQGWKLGLVDASGTDIGGYKEIVFTVEGEGAYRTLRYEGGVHRVQRVPVTEASGRIHTSAASVVVLPEVEASDDIAIPADEIRVDVFCSSGPGGQSVNTTYSAVRITHLPTGLIVQSQDERSQHRNRDKAMTVLKSRLLDLQRRQEEEKLGTTRRSMIGSGDRSDRIRTYNFPQNRLTDHRVNLTLYSLDRVVEGELDALLSALRDHDIESRLARELGGTAGN
jgi:peptide chain release factor 1